MRASNNYYRDGLIVTFTRLALLSPEKRFAVMCISEIAKLRITNRIKRELNLDSIPNNVDLIVLPPKEGIQ